MAGCETRLVLFPGLGADERMFQEQRRGLPFAVEVPGWIAVRGKETLAEYAVRMADEIPPARESERLWLGGASFGGMLAMEVARHRPCQGVILISSCRGRGGLPRLARAMGPAARWMPALALHWIKGGPNLARWLFGAATAAQATLFREMLRETPAEFLKWSMCTAATWPGVQEERVPVYQIHGRRDRVIRCPKHGIDEIVDGAGHLINLTHADAVNQFIQRYIAAPGLMGEKQ